MRRLLIHENLLRRKDESITCEGRSSNGRVRRLVRKRRLRIVISCFQRWNDTEGISPRPRKSWAFLERRFVRICSVASWSSSSRQRLEFRRGDERFRHLKGKRGVFSGRGTLIFLSATNYPALR